MFKELPEGQTHYDPEAEAKARLEQSDVDAVRYFSTDLTQSFLKEILSYDKNTGIFKWIKRISLGTHVGDIAGCDAGYIKIGIQGFSYPAHCLAWLYVYGEWPKGFIDHKDHNKGNNRLSNLRDVTISGNQQNRIRARKDNKVGLLGVSIQKKTGKYQAQIKKNNKSIFLGIYSTPEEAHNAYIEAKRKLHETCIL